MKNPTLLALALLLAGMPSYARWSGGGASRGGGGNWGGGHAAAAPSSRGMSFARDSSFSHGIVAHQGVERVPNHYYFHNEGGNRYWHYFGRGGLHWYGFYLGPSFYWFPYYSGYWWWYNENLARWTYWYDGYWWWNGPGGVPYVYADGDYVPYSQYQPEDQGESSENEPQPPSAPPAAPPSTAAAAAPAKEGSVVKSPDAKRMVQIEGSDGGASLFDESTTPPTFMKYLGENVEKVRFSGGSILVDFKDGTFALFDQDGKPSDKPAAEPAQK